MVVEDETQLDFRARLEIRKDIGRHTDLGRGLPTRTNSTEKRHNPIPTTNQSRQRLETNRNRIDDCTNTIP